MNDLKRADWIAIATAWSVAVAVSGCAPPQIVSQLNPASIRSIRVGMTEQQVTTILGKPLRIRPWGEASAIYDYAIPGWGFSSPALWIYLEKGMVHTVQGKRYQMFGQDKAVYEARGDRPTFESPEFESTFSRPR
jgi:hypothetical protein